MQKKQGPLWHWLRFWFAVLFLSVLGAGVVGGALWAQEVEKVKVYSQDEEGVVGLYVDAQTDFSLSPELREAATKGVPLYFTADIAITKHRWWWFDKTILTAERTWKLVYSPLTRQWRIGSGDLLRPAQTLPEALLSLHHIHQWRIGELSQLQPDTTYTGRFRLRLDSSLLARPFQVDVFNRSSWSLETPWHEFQFSISAAKPQP